MKLSRAVPMVLVVLLVPARAAAVQCYGPTVVDDPRVAYEDADAVALGQARTDGRGHRILRISTVLKGRLPSMIDLGRPTCPDGLAPSEQGLFLTRYRWGWSVDAAPVPVTDAAARPLPHHGTGRPYLLQVTGSRRDPLLTLDAQGGAIASARTGTRYEFASVCPGRRLALAWRRNGRSDRIRLPDLRRVGRGPRVGELPVGSSPGHGARCTAPDGHAALVSEGFDPGRLVRATTRGNRVLLGPMFNPPAIVDARHALMTAGGDDGVPGTLSMVDLATGRTAWRWSSPQEISVEGVSPDADQAYLLVQVTPDAAFQPATIDLRGTAHRVHRLAQDTVPSWFGTLRAGPWAFSDAVYGPRGRLVRRPRTGGRLRTFPLPLPAKDLESLTG